MDSDESFLTWYTYLPSLEAQWNKLSVSIDIEHQLWINTLVTIVVPGAALCPIQGALVQSLT